MVGRRRGFGPGGGGGGHHGGGGQSQDRLRTHLFFSSQSEHSPVKRKRRTQNRLHQQLMLPRKDEMVQTGPTELDPTSWSGNQRVQHFGPMAQRDPFFYYYPKGWDILYPAHFGFFPYRTSKFRGSSPIICLSSFGLFFLIGGALMTYLGYIVLHSSPFWTWPVEERRFLPPIQIAGPAFVAIGLLLLFLGFAWWFCTLNLFKETLRHTQLHHGPPGRTIRTYIQREPTPKPQPKYHPLPPPAYPILANAYTEPTVFSPQAELKLYPPVMPGYSALSLHGIGRSVSSFYVGSPYNTLQAPTTTRYHPSIDQGSLAGGAAAEDGHTHKKRSADFSRRRSEQQHSRRTRSQTSRRSSRRRSDS